MLVVLSPRGSRRYLTLQKKNPTQPLIQGSACITGVIWPRIQNYVGPFNHTEHTKHESVLNNSLDNPLL